MLNQNNYLKFARRAFEALAILVLLVIAIPKLAIAESSTIFSANFNTRVPPEFSGITTIEGVQGYAGIGTGTNVFGGKFLRNIAVGKSKSKTVLKLTGLPQHTRLDINFLLAIIDSWDGNSGGYDPDIMNVVVDGNLIFSESFQNMPGHNWSYPNINTPSGVSLANQQSLGFNIYSDSAYNMGLEPAFHNIPHTASTLTIEWFASGNGWQGGEDESWAIDNVEVHIPSPPQATAVSPTAILFAWGDYSGGISHRIQRKEGNCNSLNPWMTLADIPATKTSFFDARLLSATPYSYQFSSYFGSGSFSEYSVCASATTGTLGTPHIPVGLTTISRSPDHVDLFWRDVSDDETSFNIYRQVDAGGWVLLDTVAENVERYTDATASGNNFGTNYQYDVRACNASGCSPLSNTPTLPFRPIGLTASILSNIRLTWKDKSIDESGFEIQRKNGACNSENSWGVINTTVANTKVYDDENALPGTTYAYRLRAYYKTAAKPQALGYSRFTNCVSAIAP